MDNLELGRAIGRIETGLKDCRGDIRELKSEVKSLNNFKWKTTGIVAFLLLCFEGIKFKIKNLL